jgi:hypothetical protein
VTIADARRRASAQVWETVESERQDVSPTERRKCRRTVRKSSSRLTSSALALRKSVSVRALRGRDALTSRSQSPK